MQIPQSDHCQACFSRMIMLVYACLREIVLRPRLPCCCRLFLHLASKARLAFEQLASPERRLLSVCLREGHWPPEQNENPFVWQTGGRCLRLRPPPRVTPAAHPAKSSLRLRRCHPPKPRPQPRKPARSSRHFQLARVRAYGCVRVRVFCLHTYVCVHHIIPPHPNPTGAPFPRISIGGPLRLESGVSS